MKDPIDRSGLREKFWEKVPLKNLAPKEWEALCDGCGRCCLPLGARQITERQFPELVSQLTHFASSAATASGPRSTG